MRKDSFKRICSKALSQRLLTELTEVENANVVIKSNVLPINNDFRIVPYAVLDCNFAERMSMDNPWKGTRYLLSPRRFLQNGYPRSWQQLKHINDKVVYGFDCIWRSNLEIVLKTEG